jgi:hypothetical protein
MAIDSLLTANGQGYGGIVLTPATQKAIAAARDKVTASAGAAPVSSTSAAATISAAARAAAAAKADNAKDFTALSKDVRATLTAQYSVAKAAGDASPEADLSAMSGRALAAIALDRGDIFTRAEGNAAKAELRNRMRQDVVASGGGLAGITTYSKQMVTRYDSASVEEREALGWTAKTRGGAAALVQQVSRPSIWDQLDAVR